MGCKGGWFKLPKDEEAGRAAFRGDRGEGAGSDLFDSDRLTGDCGANALLDFEIGLAGTGKAAGLSSSSGGRACISSSILFSNSSCVMLLRDELSIVSMKEMAPVREDR